MRPSSARVKVGEASKRKAYAARVPRAHCPETRPQAQGPGYGSLTDPRVLFTKVECPLAQPLDTLVILATSARVGGDGHVGPESTNPHARVKDQAVVRRNVRVGLKRCPDVALAHIFLGFRRWRHRYATPRSVPRDQQLPPAKGRRRQNVRQVGVGRELQGTVQLRHSKAISPLPGPHSPAVSPSRLVSPHNRLPIALRQLVGSARQEFGPACRDKKLSAATPQAKLRLCLRAGSSSRAAMALCILRAGMSAAIGMQVLSQACLEGERIL